MRVFSANIAAALAMASLSNSRERSDKELSEERAIEIVENYGKADPSPQKAETRQQRRARERREAKGRRKA